MSKTIIDDGFNAELVSNAFFDGLLEIPVIEKPKEIVIPSALIPFTQMKRSGNKSEAVHFYEHDKRFFDVLTCTKELLPELSSFSAVISRLLSISRYAVVLANSKHLHEPCSRTLFAISRIVCYPEYPLGR